MVRLSKDDDSIAIQDLRPEMTVWTPCGPRPVKAVIATAVRDAFLCNIGTLSVTPWHPIQQANGDWTFPCEVSENTTPYTGDIYSVLLGRGPDPDSHAIMVGESVCVTLGHGIQAGNEDIRAHGFFGSYKKVVGSLELLPRDANGVLKCEGVKRHPKTGLACEFVGAGRFKQRVKLADAGTLGSLVTGTAVSSSRRI